MQASSNAVCRAVHLQRQHPTVLGLGFHILRRRELCVFLCGRNLRVKASDILFKSLDPLLILGLLALPLLFLVLEGLQLCTLARIESVEAAEERRDGLLITMHLGG